MRIFNAAAGTSIGGHKTVQSLNDQVTQVEFTGRVTGAEITLKAPLMLRAISTIIRRMGAKVAQDFEKDMQIRQLRFRSDVGAPPTD